MEPWRGTLPMCRSWIRDSGRDIYHVISYSSYISHNNNKNNNDNVDFSLIIASFTIAFSIISLKIIFFYYIIIIITNSVSNTAYFLLNPKTQHCIFSKWKKSNSAPNTPKFPILPICRICRQRWQLDLFSDIYLYLEF